MMLHLTRPEVTDGFEEDMAKVRDEVRRALANGAMPKIRKEPWKKYKLEFSRRQHGRCGYCEVSAAVGHHGDVEHYAPKNEVTRFGAGGGAEEGTEVKYLAKVTGRRPSERWQPGYWWLAYSWENYLYACSVCNSVWKSTLFPVKEPPARARPRLETDPEEHSLLLNPYGRLDPARHLRFRVDGLVEPRRGSPYGRETIRTCGLNRLLLIDERRPTCQAAWSAVTEAATQMVEGVALTDNKGLRDLHRMGQDGDGARFPGVVRAIICDQLPGLTWSVLDELFGE